MMTNVEKLKLALNKLDDKNLNEWDNWFNNHSPDSYAHATRISENHGLAIDRLLIKHKSPPFSDLKIIDPSPV
jgi:hypothetical protein